MSNAVEIHHTRAVVDAYTAAEIKSQVKRIQEVMQAVMKKDMHYGIIPGTPKPTLYKAGSEVLLSTFRIAVDPEILDLSTSDEIRYQVKARGVHMSSGVTVGVGVGEASTNEEKYKWREATCVEEFDATDDSRRRVKYRKDYRSGQVSHKYQIRAEPSDAANTVLKMAKKRAQIDLTLTALAASDIFSQDADDMPPEYRHMAEGSGKPETAAPQATGNGGKAATNKQIGLIKVRLTDAGLEEAALCAHLGIESIDSIPFAKVNDALAFITDSNK